MPEKPSGNVFEEIILIVSEITIVAVSQKMCDVAKALVGVPSCVSFRNDYHFMSSLLGPSAAVVAMVRLFSCLGPPAIVDRSLHNGPVLVGDSSDEENLDVMFNRDELRVVDPRLYRDVLVGSRHLHADRWEAKFRLIWYWCRTCCLFTDNAVLAWFDTRFPASLVSVRQDRSTPKISTRVLSGRVWGNDEAYTQVQCPSSFAMIIKRRKPVQTLSLWSCRATSSVITLPPPTGAPIGSGHITLKTCNTSVERNHPGIEA